MIGGPPKPPAAEAKVAEEEVGSVEQGHQAHSQPTLQAPALDQEIIEQAKAQAAELQAQANELLEQAQMQANQMIQEAMAQASQAAEEARQAAGQQGYQEGLEAGLQEGRQAGQAEARQLTVELKNQFISLVKLRREVMVDMEPEVVRLAWEVAKRVVGEELKTNRDVIVGVVRSSLATLNERDEILIRVNPVEYEAVKAYQTQFEAMIEGLRKFTIQPDGAIEIGSCAIETNLGNVDARIDTQFEAIRIGLEEMCGIRKFERQDLLAATPVEVPGDPDFQARMKAQEHAPSAPQPHQEVAPPEPEVDSEPPQPQPEESQEMEILPEPTEELFATLSPEEQQQYLEAYHQQQEYLQQLQAQMIAEQQQAEDS